MRQVLLDRGEAAATQQAGSRPEGGETVEASDGTGLVLQAGRGPQSQLLRG